MSQSIQHRKIRSVARAIMALVFLAALAYALYRIFLAAGGWVASLDSDIAVAIVAASAAGFVSVLSLVLSKAYESNALVRKEHREKKVPTYVALIEFVFRVVMGEKLGNKPSDAEILEFIYKFNQDIMIWGSDEVLGVWVKWRRTAMNAAEMKQNPMHLIYLYEDLILAIRRDLGHKNRNLVRGDILSVFVSDIDRILPRGPN